MKLTKKLVKKGLKNQIITIMHMIIFNVVSFIIFYASNIGTEPTGKAVSPGLMPLREYKVNLYFVIFSWIIFLLAFSIFYTKFLKKDFKKQVKIHWSFILLFFIVSVIFVLVELAIFIIMEFMATRDFYSSITNYPDFILYIVLAYIIGYILIDIIREIIIKKEKNIS